MRGSVPESFDRNAPDASPSFRVTLSGALPALLGGIYSSTATTVVLARRQREAGRPNPELSAGIIATTAVMYPRLAVVVAFFSPSLAATLLPGLGVLAIIAAGLAWWEWRKIRSGAAEELAIPAVNPLQLTTALTFAGLFLVISLVTAWVASAFGETGIFTLAALVGDQRHRPFCAEPCQGGAPGIASSAAAAAVLIAASANNLAKAGYAVGFGGLTATARPAVLLGAFALLGVATAVIYFWMSAG